MCQGGDFTRCNGTGRESIYGEKFDDENFTREAHGSRHLAHGKYWTQTNASQFFICVANPERLRDGLVVLDKVREGRNIQEATERSGSRHGKAGEKIVIANCGQI
ncbi:peptidyl-prolyl cis-trans isomerase a [Lynx pardinus]|uniref:Peptidyl-prolyl cis-trans isomerase a n=1 Tax=Lynx pardinus TaxID=191816 RepID=A0A485MB86_LYNPA|nr:peptidyl-prolyl cis-trans isomerase a [Lynx pardinus]